MIRRAPLLSPFIDLCNDIIAEEAGQEDEVAPAAAPEMAERAPSADCPLCLGSTPIADVLPVRGRGSLCRACVEVIREAWERCADPTRD